MDELSLDVCIYDSLDIELKEIWNKFELESSYSAFQSFSWVEAWYDDVGSTICGVVLQIVVVKNNGVTYAIFPLCVRTFMHIKILEWVGGINSDYLGPLLSDGWNNAHFLELLNNVDRKIQKYDIMLLTKQTAKVNSIDNPFVFELNSRHNRDSHQAILDENWDKFHNSKIKHKIIADIRRQKKRLSHLGVVKFVVADNVQQKRIIIREMIKQKRYRYQQTGEWDMLSIPEYKRFYERLAEVDSDVINIHCSSLSVDDKIIATHVGLVLHNQFYYVMPSNEYNDWGRYSPGKVLLEYLIKWSIDNKIRVFDFTIGDESYKKQWCGQHTDLYESVKVVTLKGWLYALLWRIKDKLNKTDLGKIYVKKVKEIIN